MSSGVSHTTSTTCRATSRLVAEQEGGRPAALYVAEDDRAMLLPLVIRELGDGQIDATSPYGYPGPLLTSDDERFTRLAFAAGRQALKDAGVVSAFIRLHPLLKPTPPNGLGVILHHGDTVSIDLTISEEALWSQLRTNHRRDITRARAAGWEARIDDAWEHFETFKVLYAATMARRGATAFYSFDDAYFSGLRDALGDSMSLVVVEREGVIAAAGLFVRTGGIVEYHLSGTDEAHLSLQPVKLMLHFVSVWARQHGATVHHLGGGVGAASDSLLHFKLGFSSRRHPFSTLRMVLDLPAYRRLVRERDEGFDALATNAFFPLYRQP